MTAEKFNSVEEEQESWLEKAFVLSEALPYMKKYSKKTFVIKYGGHAMGDKELSSYFARDVVLFQQVGIKPVVVHGGGPQIGRMLERLKIKSDFINGLRITDKATVDIVEMVLSGSINKEVVTEINQAGGNAVGLSGKDSQLIMAKKLHRTLETDSNIEKALDLGFVGEPEKINPHILTQLEASDIIPVIAPIGTGADGETFNINADTAAGAVASEINAARLFMLTDVPGVLDNDGNLIHQLSIKKAKELIKNGTIKGGMIPKVETCIQAVEKGAEAAVILDGRVPHALLLEVFTPHGAGTLIKAE